MANDYQPALDSKNGGGSFTKHFSQRPTLEILEERTLLSTCHVNRLADSGGGFGLRGDLRYCINKVNDLPGPDEIDFQVSGTIALKGALPHIGDDLKIVGSGVDLLTINAQNTARVLYIEADVDVEISDVTMRNGYELVDEGGGIYNEGRLVLQRCSIAANRSWQYGGGIYNEGLLSLSDCSVRDNTVSWAGPPWVYRTWGGGIYNASGASLVIHDSLVFGNRNEHGFSMEAFGAGIANSGYAAVFNTTISANLANPPYIGTTGGYGGGIYNQGELLVDSSLISKNTAAGDCAANGGGIGNGLDDFYPGGKITIINSTITENLAIVNDGCGFAAASGGGINTENGGTVTVTHSTIARNRSLGVADYVKGFGGGVSARTGALHLQNTIVAGNRAETAFQDFSGDLTTSGYNLFGDSLGGSGYASTDILDVNARLAPLADNGGLTHTMALLPGSPAIDAGDNTDAPEFDQRGPGFPRIVNDTIDIGAFEVQATTAALPTNFFAILITADFNTDDANGMI